MAKTPTPMDISLPSVGGARPVAGYDVSAFGAGGQALARGAQQLGQGIERAGTDLAEWNTNRLKSSALLAQDNALGDAIALREKYKHDTDYATLPERYGNDLQQIMDKHLSTIPEGPLRDHAQARMQIPFAHERASVSEQAFQAQRNDFRSKLIDEADGLINTTGPNEDPLHSGKMQSFGQRVQLASQQGFISPVEAEQMQRKLARGVIDAEFRARFRSGRDQAARALYELEGAQSGDPYVARLFHIESGGNPYVRPTGSNRGLGQFGPAEERKYGITDANRTDPAAQARAVQMEAAENAPVLSRATGRRASDADLYLAHQQGQAGAVALLTNPSVPAWQAVRKYYGSDAIAKQAIYGNIPDGSPLKRAPIDQISAAAFTGMWKDKFEMGGRYARAVGDSGQQQGDQGAVSPAWDILTPAHRDTLIREGQLIQRAYDTDDRRAVKEQEDLVKETSRQENLRVFGAIHTGSEPVTVQGILDNPKLTPEHKEKLVDLLERRTRGEGQQEHDAKTYGAGFYDAFRAVHAPDGSPERITDPSTLYPRLGADLTMAGIDKLTKEIEGKRTPEGEAEGEMKRQFLRNARGEITGTNEGLHIKDTKGEELYLKWLAQVLPAYEKARKEGKTAAQLFNSDSPDYLGKSIAGFKRPNDQWFSDLVNDNAPDARAVAPAPAGGAAKFDPRAVKSLADLQSAYQRGQVSREDASAIAIERGWAARKAPAAAGGAPMHVPVSQ